MVSLNEGTLERVGGRVEDGVEIKRVLRFVRRDFNGRREKALW